MLTSTLREVQAWVGRGGARVHLSNSGRAKTSLPLGISGDGAEVLQPLVPPGKEAITLFLDAHKEEWIRQGSGLKYWATSQF